MGQGVGIQAVDNLQQPRAFLRIVFLAQAEKPLTQGLHGIEYPPTGLGPEDISHQGA